MSPASSAPARSLRRECGLVWPARGAAAFAADVHVIAAVLVAIPVWWGLATGLAPMRARAPVGWQAWMSLVLVRPVLEEVVFRGLLQGQLLRLGAARRLGPVSLANVLATLAFVAAHAFSQPPAWTLATLAPSLVFGHLRERFGSVWPAIVVHALYNTGFGFAALLVPK